MAYQLIVRQVREGQRIAFPKHTVTEVGVEPDGPIWTGTIRRQQRRSGARWGGEVRLLLLADVTIASRPGKRYPNTEVALRADDVVTVNPEEA